VQVVETGGAQDNLRRLADRTVDADVGFVLGGVTEGIETGGLVSWAACSFNRSWSSIAAGEWWNGSQLEGRRVAIGRKAAEPTRWR
jgi:hypothetical protein